MTEPTSTPACRCCDSVEHLLESWGQGGLNDVCRPCFSIWYDGVQPRADGKIYGEDIRAFNINAKEAGTWPFQRGSEFA